MAFNCFVERLIISTRNLRSLSPIMIKLDDLLHNSRDVYYISSDLESFNKLLACWLDCDFSLFHFPFAHLHCLCVESTSFFMCILLRSLCAITSSHFSNAWNCFLIHLAKIQLDSAIDSSLASPSAQKHISNENSIIIFNLLNEILSSCIALHSMPWQCDVIRCHAKAMRCQPMHCQSHAIPCNPCQYDSIPFQYKCVRTNAFSFNFKRLSLCLALLFSLSWQSIRFHSLAFQFQ